MDTRMNPMVFLWKHMNIPRNPYDYTGGPSDFARPTDVLKDPVNVLRVPEAVLRIIVHVRWD
eukprot:7403498-Pyramimonas_sp.AAC.1